ncbi:hypothetical protein GB937_001747 [Aspergillus fischeri]|nr:hypothetical protein GB937_001747 [Aspergillus fischeri]
MPFWKIRYHHRRELLESWPQWLGLYCMNVMQARLTAVLTTWQIAKDLNFRNGVQAKQQGAEHACHLAGVENDHRPRAVSADKGRSGVTDSSHAGIAQTEAEAFLVLTF